MPDGYRYPGSLIVRVLVNKYYALQRKYRKESTKPGRLAPLQAWFFKWEGAVVGGLFAGGLVTLGVKLYITERLDDIERRVERRQWYEGSCSMVGDHLAAIQNSVSFWESLAQAAQHQASLRQPWQQQQQQRSQAAAQKLAQWQIVCSAVCRSKHGVSYGAADAAIVECAGQPGNQQRLQVKQQSDGTFGVHTQEQQGQQGAGFIHVQQQQQQVVQDSEVEQLQQVEQPAEGQLQQQQVHLQHTAQQQAQEHSKQQDLHQRQHHSQQQQQQLASSHQHWNPLCWYVARQLQAAQQQQQLQQAQAALQEAGLALWRDMAQLSKLKVRTLQQIQLQQQELLLAHAQMLSRWQQLHTRSSEFSAGLDLLSPAEMYAAVTSSLARGWGNSSISRSRNEAESKAVPQQRRQQDGQHHHPEQQDRQQQQHLQQQQQQQPLPASRATAGGSVQSQWLLNRLWRGSNTTTTTSSGAMQEQQLTVPEQQQQHSAVQGSRSASPESPAAAGCVAGQQQQQQQQPGGWHLSVHLWLPQWVPEVVEDLDFELTSQHYIHALEAAAEAALAAEEAADLEQQQQACW